jgi:hypothetical protein
MDVTDRCLNLGVIYRDDPNITTYYDFFTQNPHEMIHTLNVISPELINFSNIMISTKSAEVGEIISEKLGWVKLTDPIDVEAFNSIWSPEVVEIHHYVPTVNSHLLPQPYDMGISIKGVESELYVGRFK